MGIRGIRLVTFVFLFLAALACKETVTDAANTIEFRNILPDDFLPEVAAQIQRVEVILDEPPGSPSLFPDAGDARCFDHFGQQVCIESVDTDNDSKFERRVSLLANPFSGSKTWSLFLWHLQPIGDNLLAKGRLSRLDGGLIEVIAEASASTTTESAAIQFGGGEKRVDLTYDCVKGVVCRSADQTAPETFIDAGPRSPSKAPATFAFSCNEGACRFQCGIDDGGPISCTSPYQVSLGDGPHTFTVRAVDDAENSDETPAQYSWMSDSTPPVSSVAVDAAASVTYGATVVITGTATDNLSGVARVELSTDGGGTWATVAAQPGAFSASFTATAFSHRVISRATDDAGNVETPDAAVTVYTMGIAASDLLGMTTVDFNLRLCPGDPQGRGLNSPSAVSVDTDFSRLFVADTRNHRLLVFSLLPDAGFSDFVANAVLGQPDMSQCGLATTQTAMNRPSGVFWERNKKRLWVTDQYNNRVLVFDNAASVASGRDAGFVIGQPDFTTMDAGGGATGLYVPHSVAVDPARDRLFVSDKGNGRVLVFNLDGGMSNGLAAANVIGQTDFDGSTGGCASNKFYSPTGLAWDSDTSRLFVADSSNSRILVFPIGASMVNGMDASVVLGSSGFTTCGSATTATGLNSPIGLTYDSATKRLFVADKGNHRVVVYQFAPDGGVTSGQSAVAVFGQMLFDAGNNGTTQGTLYNPAGVAYIPSGARLIVADTDNHRIVVFDAGAMTNGVLASHAFGQMDPQGQPLFDTGCANGTGNVAFKTPAWLAFDTNRNRLFVVDYGAEGIGLGNRILVFNLNDAGAPSDRVADFAIGQPDFSHCAFQTTQSGVSLPVGVSFDAVGDHLFVADMFNSRVLVFAASALATGMNASYVIGQPNFTSKDAGVTRSTLNYPVGVAVDSNRSRLFVADSRSARVLVFSLASLSNGMDADFVIGQDDFTTRDAGLSASRFLEPGSLAYQPSRNRLFVGDVNAKRVLVFELGALANGMAASFVIGQPDFASNAAPDGGPPDRVDTPYALAVDDARQRLYVSDLTMSRVLVFDLNNALDGGMAAFNVIGQPRFGPVDAGIGQTSLANPVGVALDSTGRKLYVSDYFNFRVLLFDVGP